MSDADAWFEYSRTALRFTAKPVRPVGWVVFLAMLTTAMAISGFTGCNLIAKHPLTWVVIH